MSKQTVLCAMARVCLAAGFAGIPLLAACHGTILGDIEPEAEPAHTGLGGVSGPGTGGAGGGAVVINPAAVTCDPKAPLGPAPLLKLSTQQYRNTIRDLLIQSDLEPVVAEIKDQLAAIPDDAGGAFRALDNRISLNHVSGYFAVATAIAGAITSRPERLTAVAGACATAQPLSAACVDDFLAGFGRRALRRPLSPAELANHRQMNDGRPAAEVFRALTVLLLTSPRFLNHLEVEGTPIGGREDDLDLSPYEIASRISYTFWQSLPDDGLLAAAADGALATPDGFAREVDRAFADPRTRQTLWQFWNEWLKLEAFTGFSADRPGFKALAAGENVGAPGHDHYADMVAEVRALTDLVVWQKKGSLGDLLTTDVSVTRSADLARLYGVAPWDGNGEPPRFAPGTRAGLLQRAALLVSNLEQTNPFHRGSLVRRSILCDPLPRPDPTALPPGALDPPPPSSAETTRQRFAKKTEGGLCVGCHSQFNDLGYVLEAFDALGRLRTSEKVYDEKTGALLGELPIDLTAEVRVALDDRRPVTGAAELNRRIVESGKVDLCLAANYFSYVFRREGPTAATADGCVLEELTRQIRGGAALPEVFKQIAFTPSFRRRRVGTP